MCPSFSQPMRPTAHLLAVAVLAVVLGASTPAPRFRAQRKAAPVLASGAGDAALDTAVKSASHHSFKSLGRSMSKATAGEKVAAAHQLGTVANAGGESQVKANKPYEEEPIPTPSAAEVKRVSSWGKADYDNTKPGARERARAGLGGLGDSGHQGALMARSMRFEQVAADPEEPHDGAATHEWPEASPGATGPSHTTGAPRDDKVTGKKGIGGFLGGPALIAHIADRTAARYGVKDAPAAKAGTTKAATDYAAAALPASPFDVNKVVQGHAAAIHEWPEASPGATGPSHTTGAPRDDKVTGKKGIGGFLGGPALIAHIAGRTAARYGVKDAPAAKKELTKTASTNSAAAALPASPFDVNKVVAQGHAAAIRDLPEVSPGATGPSHATGAPR